VSNENAAPGAINPESQGASSVGQTGNVGSSTSTGSGAAKVFKEFKWGLLTLFLLMVVVIGLVYDGGRKKRLAENDPAKSTATPEINLDSPDASMPPGSVTPLPSVPDQPVPPATGSHNNTAPVIDTTPESTPPPPPSPVTSQPTPGLGEPHPTPKAAKPEITHPAPAPAPSHDNNDTHAPGGEKTYVVQNGDTLTKIASSQLPGKGSVKAILAANKDVLSDPNKLKVGMKLKIPAMAEDSKTAKPAVSVKTAEKKSEKAEKSEKSEKSEKTEKTEMVKAPDAPKEAEEYVVQSGDTLEKIARKVLNDGRKWRELYEWNRDQLPDPGRLRVGQVLKVKEAAAIKAASATHPRTHAEAELPHEETKNAPVEKVATHSTSEKEKIGSKPSENKPAPTKVAAQFDEVQSCSTSAFAP
jgi:nucleoid-associated protein YgaU